MTLDRMQSRLKVFIVFNLATLTLAAGKFLETVSIADYQDCHMEHYIQQRC